MLDLCIIALGPRVDQGGLPSGWGLAILDYKATPQAHTNPAAIFLQVNGIMGLSFLVTWPDTEECQSLFKANQERGSLPMGNLFQGTFSP